MEKRITSIYGMTGTDSIPGGKDIVKRITVFILMCILVLTNGYVSPVQAAEIKTPYLAEQAMGQAPNAEVYVTGSKMTESSSVSGKIEDINLQQNGDIVTFETSGENIHYIILMDDSGSVNAEQFKEAKVQLSNLRQSLKKGDRMDLYTVGSMSADGEKTKVFERKVKEGDAKKEADCAKINALEIMSSKSSMTVLYRSINEVIHEQMSPKMRTILLLITDGQDDSTGKDNDSATTSQNVKDASIPVYGIFLNTRSGKEDEKMQFTRNTILNEKNCRGYYHDCSTSKTADSVTEAFAVIERILKQQTCVVKLKAASNRNVGRSALELTINNTAVPAVTIDYTDYVKDEQPPVISRKVEVVSKNSISFTLSDEYGVNKTDAGNKANYEIQTKSEDDDGKIWSIDSVSAVENGNETTITLTMSDDLFNDDYILKCSNIHDESQDANVMSASAEFTVTKGLDAKKVARQEFIKSYWWIALILLVIVIGIIMVIVIRKKRVQVVEVDPDELVKADSKLIWLTITDRSGAIKDVEWNVEGSLFVGRSNICNIYFDDDRMSKQHFVIEVTKMGCYITDLESKNGTFVNGVQISSRRMILDGDVITAGREKFVFHVPKNEPIFNTDDIEE